MIKVGVSEIQKCSSIFKSNQMIELIDKRDNEVIGLFVPRKYMKVIQKVLEEEKKEILRKIKNIEDEMDIWDEVSGDGL